MPVEFRPSMPEFRRSAPEFRPPEMRQQEIRSNDFKPSIIQKPGESKISKEKGTRLQEELGNRLLATFKEYRDSVDSKIHETPDSRLNIEFNPPKEAVIDAETNTISYKGHSFRLPEDGPLQINKDTKKIVYTPSIIGANAETLAALGDAKTPPPPLPSTTREHGVDPVYQPKPASLTPAQQAAAAAAQAAAIQQAATQRAAAADRSRVASNTNEPAPPSQTRGIPADSKPVPAEVAGGRAGSNLAANAAKILEENEAMRQQAAEHAANTQQETRTTQQRSQEAATKASGDQNVGAAVAAKGAADEARQQGQQDRRQTAFVEETDRKTRTVRSAKPDQGIPGGKSNS